MWAAIPYTFELPYVRRTKVSTWGRRIGTSWPILPRNISPTTLIWTDCSKGEAFRKWNRPEVFDPGAVRTSRENTVRFGKTNQFKEWSLFT